jgi:hypothetical protein
VYAVRAAMDHPDGEQKDAVHILVHAGPLAGATG